MGQAEIIPPDKSGAFTRVTAWVRLGRGVVGNTTFAFWGACILAGTVAVPMILTGNPGYALLAIALVMACYFIFQAGTWIGVTKAPDAPPGAAQRMSRRSIPSLRQ